MGRLWVVTCAAAALAAMPQVEGETREQQVSAGSPELGGEAVRAARSSQVLPSYRSSQVLPSYRSSQVLPSYRGDSSPFWAMRGKRPHSGDVATSWLSVAHDHLATAGRSALTMDSDGSFWVARGKKPHQDYHPFYWGSNQNLWGETPFRQQPGEAATALRPLPQVPPHPGWESEQSSRGKRDSGGPFWISRSKRQDGGPFWIARGKRAMGSDMYLGTNPWTTAMRTPDVDQDPLTSYLSTGDIFFNKREGEGPFWTSRGKKPDAGLPGGDAGLPGGDAGLPGGDPSSWVSRVGKSSGDKTFWVARGKKDAPDTPPFWISRGKRDDANITSFWFARGRKDGEAPPFWVARGKKAGETHPFWITRGKKDRVTHPFWVARGKKEEESHPFWVARGKKEVKTHPPWVAREKLESPPYWVSHARREDLWPSEAGVTIPKTAEGGAGDNAEDPVVKYLLQVLIDGHNDTLLEEPRGKNWQ